MTAGDDVRAEPGGRPADRTVAAARPLLLLEHGERRALVEGEDTTAGLHLVAEAEAVPGGANSGPAHGDQHQPRAVCAG